MTHGALVRALLGAALLTQPKTAEAPVPGPPPPSAAAVALYVAGAAVAVAGSATLSVMAGSWPPSAVYAGSQRPEPLALAGGLALGVALHALLTHALVPELVRLDVRPGWRGDPAAARAAGWKSGRWLVGAAGLGLAILTAGALLERGRFGAGQAPMLAGAVLSVSSALAWGVVVPVAAWQGSAGALSPWGP